MLLRREVPDDVVHIDAVHREAFASDGTTPAEVELVRSLRADSGWVPALSIVAVDGGEIVGHVVGTEGRLAGGPAVGIGPVGVLPRCHGCGVGSALMHAVIAAADALEYPMVVLLGDPAFYARFGFVAAASMSIHPPRASWGAHFQARPLAAYSGQSGTFHYPAPFGA